MKEKKLTIRLNQKDYSLLEEQIKLYDCSINQFFRELLRSEKAIVNAENNKIKKDIYYLLKNATNNLNQISRKLNSEEDTKKIREELKQIWQFLKE